MRKTKKNSERNGKRIGRKSSLRGLKTKLWKLFSEYVRRKYADAQGYAQCYTSGVKVHWKELQCGHAIGGRHNAVLFDEEICRPQTVAENVFLRGNYPVFTTKLIKENGMEWWEKKLEGSRQVRKYTHQELEEMIQNYKQKLKDLV